MAWRIKLNELVAYGFKRKLQNILIFDNFIISCF